MAEITPAQLRKIHALGRERGIDSETLHAHVHTLTKKDSIKSLTIREAVKVIDSLQGSAKTVSGMITDKQKNFILGLAKDIGWMDEDGAPDEERLLMFIRERFQVEQMKWLTSHKASQIIEALKAMRARKDKEDEVI